VVLEGKSDGRHPVERPPKRWKDNWTARSPKRQKLEEKTKTDRQVFKKKRRRHIISLYIYYI